MPENKLLDTSFARLESAEVGNTAPLHSTVSGGHHSTRSANMVVKGTAPDDRVPGREPRSHVHPQVLWLEGENRQPQAARQPQMKRSSTKNILKTVPGYLSAPVFLAFAGLAVSALFEDIRDQEGP